MSFDGQAEAEAILEHGLTLAGGRQYESIPDEAALESTASGIKPFLIFTFGDPFAVERESTLAGDETEHPYMFPISITGVAASATVVRSLMAGVTRTFIGFNPNPPNSTPLKSPGGSRYTSEEQGKPTRYFRTRYFMCTINLTTP
jgi:hypothetical protein